MNELITFRGFENRGERTRLSGIFDGMDGITIDSGTVFKGISACQTYGNTVVRGHPLEHSWHFHGPDLSPPNQCAIITRPICEFSEYMSSKVYRLWRRNCMGQ